MVLWGKCDSPLAAAPLAWRGIEGAPEAPREVRLVGETAAHGDVTERIVCGEHELAGALQATHQHISVGRAAEARLERAEEIRLAVPDRGGELGDGKATSKMDVDEALQALARPGRKTTFGHGSNETMHSMPWRAILA